LISFVISFKDKSIVLWYIIFFTYIKGTSTSTSPIVAKPDVYLKQKSVKHGQKFKVDEISLYQKDAARCHH
jgi:hypothetical protein